MKTLLLTTVVLLTSTAAHAFDPYAYVRGQFAGTSAKSGNVKYSSSQTAATGGYMFTNNFGVESTVGLRREKLSDTGSSVTLNELVGTLGLRAQTRVGESLVPYALASAYSARGKLDDNGTESSAGDNGFAISGGIDVESTDNLVLGVQATMFVDGPVYYGIHVGYNFKNGLNFNN